tara:strand:+ start:190 stop:648 length:459 start_codon:yes stop_codon:yes gene_type:complete
MKFKVFLLFFLILLNSCSYKPLFYDEKIIFDISEIKIEGDKKLNNKIERNLQKKISNSNPNKIFKLKIITNKERKITSKDSSGNPESFRLTIITNLIVEDDKKNVKNFSYNKSREYVSRDNKFDLKNYEKKIEDNLIIQISNEIILALYTFK